MLRSANRLSSCIFLLLFGAALCLAPQSVLGADLANVSTRGYCGTGDDMLIGGFIIEGSGSKRVLVRALGPTLGQPPYNVMGELGDPQLVLTDIGGTVLGSNDNWRTGGQEAEIIATGLAPPDDAEAGIVITLEAGAYTPIVSGVAGMTGVTIVEIYDLDGSSSGALLLATGQTLCYDATGSETGCSGTGQDGEYQMGATASPRFTDNGDGTATDDLTGLVWLKDANCFNLRNWTSALSDANSLASGSCGLTDGSVAGDWRLPNVRELASLLDFSTNNPALPAGHPFTSVQLFDSYWSSTSRIGNAAWAYYVFLGSPQIAPVSKFEPHYVLPVRNP